MKPSDNAEQIRFIHVRDGDNLAGLVDLTAEVFNNPKKAEGIFLRLDDGEDCLRPGWPCFVKDEDQPDAPLRQEIPFGLVTNQFGSGPHRLFVVDRDGRVFDERSVQFVNIIQHVHAGALMNNASEGCRLTASLTTPQPWTLQIKERWGKVVRVFEGSGRAINIYWDGRDASGKLVPQGFYYSVITALESGEKTGDRKSTLINILH